MIPESHLHYIWANRLYDRISLEGNPIEVVDVGQLNSHDGPDFELARVRIKGIEWAGAVEIHRKASEWQEHGHQHDVRYNSVILHVVLENNLAVRDQANRAVPAAIMEVDPSVLDGLSRLEVSNQSLRCMPDFLYMGSERFLDEALTLLPQRIEEKLSLLRARSDSDHFNSIFYLTLMRYVGAHQNNEQMESIARALPYQYLKKHASDATALEAMLLGQAGLLAETPRDEYEANLIGEYQFYRQKFSLTPQPKERFRYLRLRPSAFPARMLGIVAQIIHHEEELLSAITRLDHRAIVHWLSVKPSEYWQRHYDFGRTLPKALGGLGENNLRSLIINTIIPTVYYYAQQTGDQMLAQRAMDWLFRLPPESNQYTKLFTSHGVCPRYSADSQALLQLYHRYCQPMYCLRCPIAITHFQALRSTKASHS
ncbi:DUF2851 family protein [Porphyromonas levii]|uniref:DUF2851 family protein n=1 Tax=Porphyromonas levii TaxID=28114 RepID=A0A4Y8WPF1_9PORP|nr:DUF2851 family protein [Porphyromonas levii]MBR8729203.1 hypothetical protein [Porphyromonas levii]MBR8731178.1 hypothetical protein [Porphyromonas levii]MBR8764564.1 hypothetical protein [Porphyromonas levii]MBR8765066.1 hypothetical protein [Porphyromonas levii]MBR8783995.1 hypothetical protein [Porphyromonas levii]